MQKDKFLTFFAIILALSNANSLQIMKTAVFRATHAWERARARTHTYTPTEAEGVRERERESERGG